MLLLFCLLLLYWANSGEWIYGRFPLVDMLDLRWQVSNLGELYFRENNNWTKTRWNCTETAKYAKNTLRRQGKMLFCLFISCFYAQNNNRKNPHTKPYIISVMQQWFSLVSLECLWWVMWSSTHVQIYEEYFSLLLENLMLVET